MVRNSANPLDVELARLAARQHAVVAHQQLRALGLGPRGISHRVAAGRLHPVHRGVYALIDPRLLKNEGQCLAAVFACGPGAVLSHRSAADLWGMLPTSRPRPDVTVRRSGRRRPGIDIHRSGTLTAADITTVDGIPCTSVARTLLDLAEVVPPRLLRRALERAEQLRIFDRRAVDDVLRRATGRRGASILHALVTENDIGEPLTREELERRFVELCRSADLPEPLVNSPLGRYVPDFLWSHHKLIVETDGWETHGTRRAFEADRRRDQHLTKAGYRVVRFTWRQVIDERDGVVDTLAALLASPVA